MKATKLFATLLATLISLSCFGRAVADTFGSGANVFDIEFVDIGNPGNPADTTGTPTGAGSVPYTYRLGKYEISEQMIDKANILGGLGISWFVRGPDKPAGSVSWNEAARFINWLNITSGSVAAYKFALQPGGVGYDSNANIELWTVGDTGYDPNNLYRNSLAKYFLPSANEWYKAAYFDPAIGTYHRYPVIANPINENIAPTAVASGTTPGTAVFSQPIPADITLAGGLGYFGTMAQAGNMFEWEETNFNLINNNPPQIRGYRGGVFNGANSDSGRGTRHSAFPTAGGIGFRIASLFEATVAPNADFDQDTDVDGRDFLIWQRGFGLSGQLDNNLGDANFDGTIDELDLVVWQDQYAIGPLVAEITAIPEPSSLLLVVVASVGLLLLRRS
ncbi:MAG: SUMF1/EgtB/PvdO family nonheme iron enzyme [Bythopirellula sp.]|nr:SUMF1/EgtB/PvdO family nonheme iron enzyme [Bythopirellula sp.]